MSRRTPPSASSPPPSDIVTIEEGSGTPMTPLMNPNRVEIREE